MTGDIILDVMPTDTQLLGFGNEWYEAAMEYAEVIQLPSSKQIRIVSAPYFLITKLEAFNGRGGGDFQMSHDIEDIIAVLDGRPGIISEIKQADPELSRELSMRFKGLLEDNRFVDSISGHMPPDKASQSRVTVVITVLRKISSIE